jgi:ABC-2 type transport system ATP-binding protein
MIEAQRISRRFGDFSAVRDISFTLGDGEIVGMLGPNGAGKTTTIRMLTGFLPPTSGRVLVGGKDIASEPIAAKRDLGYLPENVALYPEMRVEEYLAWRAKLAGMARAAARPAIDAAIERCLLADVRRQVIETLSKGYRQRVGLAAAILHGPKVLILDEPTVGLDPRQIVAIRDLIRDLGRERTLLLSTHILPEVEVLCQRVMIIDRGKLVAEGTPAELRARSQGRARIAVTVTVGAEEAPEWLGRLAGVGRVVVDGAHSGRFTLEVDGAGEALRAEVFRVAVERGWTLVELHEERVSLEDVFVRLTTRETVVEAEPAAEVAEVSA